MKYKIQITETFQKVVEIEANNAHTAERQAIADYESGEIVLSQEDLVSAAFEPYDDLISVAVEPFDDL